MISRLERLRCLRKNRDRQLAVLEHLENLRIVSIAEYRAQRAEELKIIIERVRRLASKTQRRLNSRTGSLEQLGPAPAPSPAPSRSRSAKLFRALAWPFVLFWRFLQYRFFSPAKNAGLLAEKMSSSSPPAPASSRRRSAEENCYSPIAPGQGSER